MKTFFIFILFCIILYFFISSQNVDEFINKEYFEDNFKISQNNKPLQIGKNIIHFIKTPNNLILYKNADTKTIIFLDDYHTYINENIICNQKHFFTLTEFLKTFYQVKTKINLFIEVIKPSKHYEKYNDVIIQNTSGFNSNNTITCIIDDPNFKKCFFKGKSCKNFVIKSTDIRISNDMLINSYNIYIKSIIDKQNMKDIISITFKYSKNVYYHIFYYLQKKNKKPRKKKKYILENIENEIYFYFQSLSKKYQNYILHFIEQIYLPKMNSFNFIENYIYMFMDILTIMKMLLVPKNQIIILYQGLYHNFYIRKFYDTYIKYDYKKRAEILFKHKNKCINVSSLDEIIK